MTDHRLEAAAASPRYVRLARALTGLGSQLRILVAGAHPDDEPSGLIALWTLGQGHKVHYVCATRGQGGQNSIGPEQNAALAVLRSAEMKVAAERLGMSAAFLDSGLPGDPIHDFGFSKSGTDTLKRWGAEETLRRLVREIRIFRPDVVMPCFLDVAGQHGHHRAITETLFRAFEAAADPDFAPSLGAPWSISKLYLPAWAGSSDAYDDEEPPPPATVEHEVGARDPVSGMTYNQLGEYSRAAHASQGMGVWREAAPDPWPLHLARTRLSSGPNEQAITDGTLANLTDWGDDALAGVANAIDLARANFPQDGRMLKALAQAEALLERAGPQPPERVFRLADLRRDIMELRSLIEEGSPELPAPAVLKQPKAWVEAMPASALFNRSAPKDLQIPIRTSGPRPDAILPDDWRAGWSAGASAGDWLLEIAPPAGVAASRVEVALVFDEPAQIRQRGTYPHVGEIIHEAPACLTVGIMEVALPQDRRVAVIDSGVGTFGVSLDQLGFAVLGLDAIEEADAILLGPMGWKRRPNAAAQRDAIFQAVANGASFLSLYHRPSDDWDPATSAVKPLTIGSPSVRWRVCDPTAEVRMLDPAHPLLTAPNKITAADWQGWVRERGLYFANQWDRADWTALLSLNDPGDPPLEGALLVANHGKGRQVHCALALHRQLPALVPGACRLLANLLAKRG